MVPPSTTYHTKKPIMFECILVPLDGFFLAEYVLPHAMAIAQDTFCPGCGRVLIRRQGFDVFFNRVENDLCPDCEKPIVRMGLGSDARD